MTSPFRKTTTVLGQPSWQLANDHVEVWISEIGGHMAPVTFNRHDRPIRPLHVAPWAEETLDADLPPILKVLRGDFFCMPFGGNDEPFESEQHPPHGDTANEAWRFESEGRSGDTTTLSLSMDTTIRRGHVEKRLSLVDGHDVIYIEHEISDLEGPMSFGHHAMLRFPSRFGSGLLSFSSGMGGYTAPEPVELPENRGYSMLKPGERFDALSAVPTVFGDYVNLSHYPIQRGYEDVLMLPSDTETPFAWSAAVFPDQGYAWFALKDPSVLRQTALWISNGGRHYPPWNGRHVNVMGIEEVTSFFHYGLAQSVRPNFFSERGIETFRHLDAGTPVSIRYLMACVPVPTGCGRIADIRLHDGHDEATLLMETGEEIPVALRHSVLQTGGPERV